VVDAQSHGPRAVWKIVSAKHDATQYDDGQREGRREQRWRVVNNDTGNIPEGQLDWV
jgi:hypothetical protein